MTVNKMSELLRSLAADCHKEATTAKTKVDGEWFTGFYQGRGDAFDQAAYFIEVYLA